MRRRHGVILAVLLVTAVAVAVIARGRLAGPPTPQRLATLTRERDDLQRRWRDVIIAGGERSLAEAPPGDLMIGVPTSFLRSIVEQVVTGVFGQTTLTLENITARKAGEVKARLLIARRTMGAYVLEVNVHRVQATLEAGAPALVFERDAVALTLPVRLARGEGAAEVRFQWKSRGIADVVCDDFDVTRTITAGVVPEDYALAGRFAIAAAGETIILRPEFPDLAARIAVRPSADAWKTIDAVIRDRPRGCEMALDAMDVESRLEEILGRGFQVRVPQNIFKPIALPAGVSRSFRVQDVEIALRVKPTSVLVASDRIWYGADVSVGP